MRSLAVVSRMVGGVVALAALALLAAPFPASIASADATPPLAAPVAPGAPTGLRNEQRTREQHQQQFLRAHSDATGKVRLDLMSKGVERTRQMQVAPYIGAHALAPATAPAAAAKQDQSK